MKSKALYILLSVVVAFSLWLYVTTVVSPESRDTFTGIRVELTNKEALYNKQLMVIDDGIQTVTLDLVGNRSDLSKLSSANIIVKADVSKLNMAGDDQTVYYKVEGLPDNVSVENMNPASIKVDVVERATSEVPVQVEYVGKVPDGFLTDKENLMLDVETIPIAGPASVVNKIAKALVTVDLDGQRESIEEQSYLYTLCDADGEPVDVAYLDKPNVEFVNLSLTIQRVKEIMLGVTVIPGGGATEQSAEIILSHTSIQVSGSEQLLDTLGDTIDLGELRLAEMTRDGEKQYNFKLPEGVTNLSMPNNQVTVTVRFTGLKTKTLRVTNIQPRNVPAGMSADFMTEELVVNIRGPEDQINQMTEADVIVAVDFSNAEVGTMASYPVLVYVVNADDCGAVGSYSVYARVIEEPAESGADKTE